MLTVVFADVNGATKAGIGIDARGLGTFTMADRGGRPSVEDAPAVDDSVEEPVDSQPTVPAKPAARKK